MVVFNIDFHYKNSYTFDDASLIEDVNGYYYKRAEVSQFCYRYSFSSIDGLLKFIEFDFDETFSSLDDNFVSAVITIEK